MKLAAIVLMSLFVACRAQQLTVTLQNVTALVGTDVIIPCTYIAVDLTGEPTIRWSGVNADGSRQRLYTYVPGNEEETGKDSSVVRQFGVTNNGSLQVPSAQLSDNSAYGKLVCEVDFGFQATEEGVLTLTVVQLPTTDPTTTVEANSFRADPQTVPVGTCQTGATYPKPVVQFYRGLEEVFSDDGTESLETDATDVFSAFEQDDVITSNSDQTVTVRKTLVLALTKEDNMAQFYCIVTSGAGEHTMRQNVSFPTFNVEYETDMTMIVANPVDAFVGDTLMLTCQANGYPEPTLMFNGQTSSMVEITVSKSDNGREISCTSTYIPTNNQLSDNYTINALYSDDPIISGSTDVNLGEPLALSCEVMSNPLPTSVMWLKGNEVVSQQAMLEITSAQFSDAGVYKCMTENVYPRLNKEIQTNSVTVAGLVLNQPEDEEVAGKLKESVTLMCSASSYPAATFSWTQGGNPVDGATVNADGSVSSLTVGPLDPSMSMAEYVCTVTNGISTDSKTFILPEFQKESTTTKEIVEESSPPTAGIIIGILVALLVIAIILAVLYNKGIICKKSEKGDENAEDIEVAINKDEAPAADGETGDGDGKPEETPREDTALVSENGDQ